MNYGRVYPAHSSSISTIIRRTKLMKCQNCGAEIKDGVQFCRECGSKIMPVRIRYCRECGSALPNEAKFCPNCGASRDAANDNMHSDGIIYETESDSSEESLKKDMEPDISSNQTEDKQNTESSSVQGENAAKSISSKITILVSMLLFGALLMIGVIASFGRKSVNTDPVQDISNSTTSNSATMIDVTGKKPDEAIAMLQNAGFTHISINDSNNDWDPERIIVSDQSQLAGSTIDLNTDILLITKKICRLYVDVTSNTNLLFDTYDMDIYLDDSKIGTVANGQEFTKLVDVIEGTHVLKAVNSTNESKTATKSFMVDSDVTFVSSIAHGSSIEFRDFNVVNDISGSSLEVINVEGKVLADAVSELEEIGFVNIREEPYSEIWDKNNWTVTSQSAAVGDQIDKTTQIVLECMKTTSYLDDVFMGLTASDAMKKASEIGYEITYVDDITSSDLGKDMNSVDQNKISMWVVKDVYLVSADDKRVKLAMVYSDVVSMPDLVGMDLQEAIEKLQEQKFSDISKVSEEGRNVATTSDWEVKSQNVEAGKDVKTNDSIILTCKKVTTNTQTESATATSTQAEPSSTASTQTELPSIEETLPLTMIDVEGMILSDAISRLNEVGFTNVRGEASSDDIWNRKNWTVISQNIEAGSDIDRTTQIKLECVKTTSYLGELFIGLTVANASQKAAEIGYTLEFYDGFSRLVTIDDPTSWLVNDIRVVYGERKSASLSVVYNGNVSMPDVTGLDMLDAIENLIELRFQNITTVDEDGSTIAYDIGYEVLSQSVQAGQDVNVNENIRLTCQRVKATETLSGSSNDVYSQVSAQSGSKKHGAEYHSSNSREEARNGNSGVFAYKSLGPQYYIYYIIDFDEGYTYRFIEGNGDNTCEKVKISTGTLNDVVIIEPNYDGIICPNGLHFDYVGMPDHMILEDEDGFTTDFYPTDLEEALEIIETKTIYEH